MADVGWVEIYRAKDAIQAHIIRGALEDAGIPARVEGDLLAGGLGILPFGWSTAPRVLVAAADTQQARSVLEELEQTEAPD